MLITQARTKRYTAAAIAEVKADREWSNGEIGDALGVSDGTIRNRLEADCPKHQMTVFELARSIQSTGVDLANKILGPLAGCHVEMNGCDSAPDAIVAAGHSARCAADLIAAAPGGYDFDEAERLLPLIEEQQKLMAGIEAHLRGVLARRRRP